MPGVHSRLPASGMYRWSACPGSVCLCQDIPEQTNEYAEEGSYCHDRAASFLTGDLPAEEFKNLPEEMQKALMLYSETVDGDFRQDVNAQIFVEHKFDLSSVFPGCFGTADCVVWLPRTKRLIVYDLKYGKTLVHPEQNTQLMYYGLGALVTLRFPAKTVELVIVQPRAPHKRGLVRRWAVSSLDIMDFEVDLVDAARRTQAPDAPLVPGRHCWFCPARVTDVCPAIHAQRVNVAAEEFGDVPFLNPSYDELFS